MKNLLIFGAVSCGTATLFAAPADDARAVQATGTRAAYTENVSKPIQNPSTETEKKGGTVPAAGEDESTVRVNAFAFSGNSIFATGTLHEIVKAEEGKELTFRQIQAIALKVEEYYHENGYILVQVVIPPKSLNAQGTLTLQVVEGKLGNVAVFGNKRYSEKRVVDTVNTFVKRGESFTIANIESALSLLNSRSGISVRSALAAGETAGTTDLAIEVTESARVSGSLEINNFGSEDSGEYRVIPYVAFENLTGIGDKLSFFGVTSFDEAETWSAQANYIAPVNNFGTSVMGYFGIGKNTVGNEYAVLDIEGDSLNWGVGASHKLFFSAKTSLEFEAMFEWSDMKQDMLGVRNYDDKIRKIRLGSNFDHTDSTGRTLVSFNVNFGLGEAFGGMDDDTIYSSRPYAKADDNFTKFTFGVMRVQSFSENFYGLANFTAQWSFDPLVSGEQIYFGGANTVRGQPYSCCAGDDGILLNLELRYTLLDKNPNLQFAAFFDHGESHLQEPAIGQENWTSMSGAGVGVRIGLFGNLDLRFDVAFPLGAKQSDCDDCYFYGQIRYTF